jgi:hypothetical protein
VCFFFYFTSLVPTFKLALLKRRLDDGNRKGLGHPFDSDSHFLVPPPARLPSQL